MKVSQSLCLGIGRYLIDHLGQPILQGVQLLDLALGDRLGLRGAADVAVSDWLARGRPRLDGLHRGDLFGSGPALDSVLLLNRPGARLDNLHGWRPDHLRLPEAQWAGLRVCLRFVLVCAAGHQLLLEEGL